MELKFVISLSSSVIFNSMILEFQVEYALKFPFYATLERLEHKRNIEHFDARDSHMMNTEYL
jgi:ent-kaurene synthase